MTVYKKGDFITNEVGTITRESEVFVCNIADEDTAFFSVADDSKKGGFLSSNKVPMEGFRTVSEEEFYGVFSETEDDSNAENTASLSDMERLLDSSRQSNLDSDLRAITLEVYMANLIHTDKVVTDKTINELAIAKTRTAMYELFNYSIPQRSL